MSRQVACPSLKTVALDDSSPPVDFDGRSEEFQDDLNKIDAAIAEATQAIEHSHKNIQSEKVQLDGEGYENSDSSEEVELAKTGKVNE